MEHIFIVLSIIIIGFIIGILCSMVGAGGGIFFVPVFLTIYALEPRYAIGTSALSVTLLSFSSSLGYRKSKNVDWHIALIYNIIGTPGAILGAWITTQIEGDILKHICAVFLFLVSLALAFKRDKKKIESEKGDPNNKNDVKSWLNKCPLAGFLKQIGTLNSEYISYYMDEDLSENDNDSGTVKKANNRAHKIDWNIKKIFFMIFASFTAGLVSGLVGMGSGTIMTSTLVFLEVPFNLAAGSAALGIFIAHFSVVISHAIYGNIIWSYGLLMGLSAFSGARLGSRWALKLKGSLLRKILAGFALLTSLKLLFQ